MGALIIQNGAAYMKANRNHHVGQQIITDQVDQTCEQ